MNDTTGTNCSIAGNVMGVRNENILGIRVRIFQCLIKCELDFFKNFFLDGFSDVFFQAVSLDESLGKRSGIKDLAKTLSFLASLGHAVDLSAWEQETKDTIKQRMSIPLSGVNYRNQPPETRDQRSEVRSQRSEGRASSDADALGPPHAFVAAGFSPRAPFLVTAGFSLRLVPD